MNAQTDTLTQTESPQEKKGRKLADRITGSPNHGLFGATLGFFVGFAAVSLFGPTAKLLDENMMMTSVQLGLLVAMPSLSGSLLRIPFGAWVDTTGGRKPFLILLLLSAAGMAGLYGLLWLVGPESLTIDYYPLLLAFALLSGCGIATFSVGIGQVSYWFPKKKQGWALGAYAGFGNIAPGLFSYLVPLLIGAIAITATYGIWLGFLLLGIAVYYFFAPNAYFFQLRNYGYSFQDAKTASAELGQELFPQEGVWTGLIKAAKIWRTWPLVFLYFTTFGGFLALTAWFPTYWQEFFNKPLAVAGGFTMLYSVLASVIRVPGGIISDKVGGVPTIIVSMTINLIGAILLIWGGSMVMAIIGLLLMAIGMGVSNAGVFKLVPQYIEEAVGGGSGWVGGLGALGGFVIPPVMGWFVEVQGDAGYANGFLVFVVLSIISLGLVFLLKRTEAGADA
ncbi:MAG: MFS transporter [Candidatus Marinimicrobia bacterium]|nr:MFS transporter [Candidatus Neomarinimicrobiota bacterium]MCF7829305.1 MFS transporter [Candidatus Neomarinimicrobiota bacterium]MCF7880033.1 MFS transporter [Candidatus Neomarinimicrobiota bacterium]